jgi:hypothetical protein
LAGAKRPDGVYEIVETPGEGVFPIQAPEKLIRAILRESVVSVGGKEGTGELESISPEDAKNGAPYSDGRKNMVAGIAWYLAIRGEPLEGVVSECVAFGRECCVPPLSEETCVKKAEYAFNRAERYRAKEAAEVEKAIGAWARGRKWQST